MKYIFNVIFVKLCLVNHHDFALVYLIDTSLILFALYCRNHHTYDHVILYKKTFCFCTHLLLESNLYLTLIYIIYIPICVCILVSAYTYLYITSIIYQYVLELLSDIDFFCVCDQSKTASYHEHTVCPGSSVPT